MSRADKRKIEELSKQCRKQMDQIGAYQISHLRSKNREEELSKELQDEKEKYACLLERYISMMEHIAGVKEETGDEQR